jgi:hypothetical protein
MVKFNTPGNYSLEGLGTVLMTIFLSMMFFLLILMGIKLFIILVVIIYNFINHWYCC